jgi:hypothetical protein
MRRLAGTVYGPVGVPFGSDRWLTPGPSPRGGGISGGRASLTSTMAARDVASDQAGEVAMVNPPWRLKKL